MSINPSAAVISHALQTGYYVPFSNEEFDHIVFSRKLSSQEKVIWLYLSSLARRDRDFAVALTRDQLSKQFGLNERTISRAISSLIEKKFLFSKYDDQRRVTVYFVQLDSEGLDKVSNVRKRGERVNFLADGQPKRAMEETDTQRNFAESDKVTEHTLGDSVGGGQKCLPWEDKNVPPPETKMSPLNNNINNNSDIKLNKHLYHQDSDISTVLDANALLLQFQSTVERIQLQDPTLSPLKANFEARKAFSEVQLACIDHHHITTNPAQEALQATKSESPKPKVPEIKKPLQSQLVSFQLEGQCYLVEESVKNKALSQLQSLHQNQCIKGEAASKPLLTLTSEVFYYLAKAGSTQQEPISQASKLNTAIHLLLKGDWQTPNGMVKQTIIEREQKWQREKKAQTRYVPVSEWRIQYA